MSTRAQFNDALEHVHTLVLKMGSYVEEALNNAMVALIHQNKELAREVIQKDSHIDDIQVEIENTCIKIIALEQPVASDLRRLISVIKIVSDLERIGDHARHLAKSLNRVDRSNMDFFLSDIESMMKTGIEMLGKTLNAFSTLDAELAQEIATMDPILDSKQQKLYNKIIASMKKDKGEIREGSRFLVLSRFLERLGDHVLIMCDWIIFAKTGRHRA